MSDGSVLITGADGYVGLRLARHYLRRGDRPLALWVRAADPDEFARKRARTSAALGLSDVDQTLAAEAVSWSWGDLRDRDPFRRVDRLGVTQIVHSAAVTRFTVDSETARHVNIDGADKLLKFASGCPALHAVGLLSTIYSAGLRGGAHEESTYADGAGFANHYERSKWHAERRALTSYAHLPLRVLRLATVIADDEDGTVTQYNAFHNTLKLFFYGLLSLLPGAPETPLYFITGDFAVHAVATVMDDREAHGIYHVAHNRNETLALGELVDLAFREFARDQEFVRKHILRPLFTDSDSFELLVGGMSSFGGAVVNQAMSSVAPFARQLFVHKDVRNDRLRGIMRDYRAPDPRELIARTCAQLVETRWGRADAA